MRAQWVQAWDWDSAREALSCVVVGARAASRTSSRRLGIEPPSLPMVHGWWARARSVGCGVGAVARGRRGFVRVAEWVEGVGGRG